MNKQHIAYTESTFVYCKCNMRNMSSDLVHKCPYSQIKKTCNHCPWLFKLAIFYYNYQVSWKPSRESPWTSLLLYILDDNRSSYRISPSSSLISGNKKEKSKFNNFWHWISFKLQVGTHILNIYILYLKTTWENN